MDEYQLDSSNVITSGELVTRLILIHSEERMHFHNQIMAVCIEFMFSVQKEKKKKSSCPSFKQISTPVVLYVGDRRVLISKF